MNNGLQRTIGMLLCALSLGIPPATQTASASHRLNVLFIAVDDLRPELGLLR